MSDRSGGEFAWRNPVIRGAAPDPSVIRVGSDYFLATSTFEYLPGIRLYHSTDLVVWQPLGGAVTRPEQFRRDGLPGPICLFAATLRHHEGQFYLVCTNMAGRQGNFLLSAADPAGPWSDALWIDSDAFDPSLFFDKDGTCLYTRRSLDLSGPGGDLGPILQATLDPSAGTLGPMRAITPGPRGFCSNDIEGPHIYRVGGWYYLFAAEGGTWAGHMQTMARSRSPWGPFESAPRNPVLSHRHRVGHPIQSLGHAELVEDPRGGWWALALGTRHRGRHHLLGRETFLMPVEWREGWPELGEAGTIEIECRTARSPATGGAQRVGHNDLWSAGWSTPTVPDSRIGSEMADILLPFGAAPEAAAPGTLFHYQSEPSQIFEAGLPDPVHPGTVGVAMVADRRHHYALRLLYDGDQPMLSFRRQADDLVSETRIPVATSSGLHVRVEATGEAYRFCADLPDGRRIDIGEGAARLLSAEACEWFTGVKFALIAEGPADRSARFRNVRRDGRSLGAASQENSTQPRNRVGPDAPPGWETLKRLHAR